MQATEADFARGSFSYHILTGHYISRVSKQIPWLQAVDKAQSTVISYDIRGCTGLNCSMNPNEIR